MILAKYIASVAAAIAMLQGCTLIKTLVPMTSGVVDAPALLPTRARYYYGADLHSLPAHAVARALQRPENIAELERSGGQAYAFHSPTERRTP